MAGDGGANETAGRTHFPDGNRRTGKILSPYNNGLEAYRRKRAQLLLSAVHLVEIDLLRGGERPGPEVREPPIKAEHILFVNRARPDKPERISEIWPVALNEPLPPLPVPLLHPDPDMVLDLNDIIRTIYARAGYEWRIDYRKPVPPPELRPEMAHRVEAHLRADEET